MQFEAPILVSAMDVERPSDQEIQAQEQSLKSDAESSALVGEKQGLTCLREEYADNPGFLPKVEALSKRYSAMRKTRPDGNCFYRAYLYGIFEILVEQPTLRSTFLEKAKGTLEYCLGAGYEQVAVEDFHEEFVASVERLGAPGASPRTVDEILAECDGYLICWARVLTSATLKRRAEEFSAFLSSHSSIAEFCTQEVDPMARDADHLQIAALSSFLGVPATVVYLDQSDGDAAAEHVFEVGPACPYPPVHLLYRPGHYDLIYPGLSP